MAEGAIRSLHPARGSPDVGGLTGNADVTDLYNRTNVGTKIVVLR
jgi:hypothetical protein